MHLFLSVLDCDMPGLAALSSCHCNFSAMMDYNLDCESNKLLSPLNYFSFGCFITGTEMKLEHHLMTRWAEKPPVLKQMYPEITAMG